jgi:hypothetical protein
VCTVGAKVQIIFNTFQINYFNTFHFYLSLLQLKKNYQIFKTHFLGFELLGFKELLGAVFGLPNVIF